MTANHPRRRRNARMAAVQALYQMDVSGEPTKVVIRQFIEHRFGLEGEDGFVVADEPFFEALVLGVVEKQAAVDQRIADHLSEKWSLKRLDKTLRALMRAASFEIMFRPDVPALVIIDEYVAIAGEFFADNEAGFVNGALDKIAKTVRAAEFGLTGTSIGHG